MELWCHAKNFPNAPCILYPFICIILQKTTNAFHTFLLGPGTDNSMFTTGRAHYGQLIAYFLIVIDLLFIVTSIVGVCNCSMFCCTVLYAPSSLQSSWWGRESWLLCLVCHPCVSWLLCGSSSRCHGFVCSLWLWYFLIKLTYIFFSVNEFSSKGIMRLWSSK